MGGEYVVEMMLAILMSGGIYAGVLIVALLPFEIVLFVNSFWRKRFEAVFGLKKRVTVQEFTQTEEPNTPVTE
jgi:hypothetical protein